MTDAPPVKTDAGAAAASRGPSNLVLRVLSSLVLVPLAIGAAYAGGFLFLTFWAAAALIVLWEWDTIVCATDRNTVLGVGAVALAGAALLMAIDRPGTAVALITLGALGIAGLASSARRAWCALGLIYATVVLIAPVILRRDPTLGIAAILFLFVVVWLTDIAAYFVGRAVGGPKLMPKVSPNKTWSGAIGGTVAAVIGGVAVAKSFGIEGLAGVGGVALGLSVISQAGDLAESAIKRRFQVKDASGILPGHGGLMDRLDGFITASAAAALVGTAHGGLDAPARGLMVW